MNEARTVLEQVKDIGHVLNALHNEITIENKQLRADLEEAHKSLAWATNLIQRRNWQVARLTEAMKTYADEANWKGWWGSEPLRPEYWWWVPDVPIDHGPWEAARNALQGTEA